MGKKKTLNTFREKFLCGDCEAILKTMPDSSIDLVLTSPPYADKRDYGDVERYLRMNMLTGSFQRQKKSTVSSRKTAVSF